jgi:hypothetical protein
VARASWAAQAKALNVFHRGRLSRSNFGSRAGRLRDARVSASNKLNMGGVGAAPARILDLLRLVARCAMRPGGCLLLIA